MNARSIIFFLWMAFMVCVGGNSAYAQELKQIRYLVDEAGQVSLQQVTDFPEEKWQVSTGKTFSAGYDERTYWLKAELPPRAGSHLLHIAYPLLDNVQVFFLKDKAIVSEFRLGDHLPFSSRPIAHQNFVVAIPEEERLTLYLRVQTSSAVNVPLYITAEKALYAAQAKSQLGYGVYFGVLICMVLYNLFGYVIIREVSVFSYSIFVVIVGLMTAALTGVGFHYIWPSNLWLQEHALVLFGSFSFTFAAIFIHQMLEIKRYSSGYSMGLWLVGISSGLLGLISLVLPYRLAIEIMLVLATFYTLFIAVLSVAMWRRGSIYARVFACAWAAFLLAIFLNSLGYLGILSDEFMQRNAIMAGSGIEVLILSWVLTLRYANERSQKLGAQQRALRKAKEAEEAQRQLNEKLEEHVDERTFELSIALRELQQVNHELEKQNSEDGLTGLLNRRQFDTVLTSEFRRGWRSEQPLALIMLDIDYFKSVNDTYGHMIGDQILVALSKRLQHVAKRSGDSVFRYGGEEFAVLLTNTCKEQALAVAEKIKGKVNATHFTTDAGEIPITVSMGIAIAHNGLFEVPEQLFNAADEALYQAKSSGRDQIVCADTA